MQKLRVAVLNTQPPHLFYGGVERRIIEIAKRVSRCVDVIIYSGMKAGFKKTTQINGITIVPCFSTDTFFPIDNWFFNETIARTLTAIRVDVYEAHTVSGYKLLMTLRKRKIHKPFIQTIHGVLADEYVRYTTAGPITPRMRLSRVFLWYLANLERMAARESTLIVTISNFSMKRISQLYHVKRDKIRIVPNGVDIHRFRPMKVSDDFRLKMNIAGESCILFVGNLVPRKGLRLLIEAAVDVIKNNKDVKFIIVGDGPLKNSLIAYAHKLGVLKNFIFLGNVDDDTLIKLYNCSDVVTLPSFQEGQGITLLEAQATAKPVVACKVGGISEAVLDGETGLLVNPNSREIAGALITLLSDKTLRDKMGEKGREHICRNFSWEICAQKMLHVYEEALTLT
ncbi:MAG: glycosyltransferase family 4 protein [Candidatus Bathyarchaeia archaeon]